MSLASRVLIVSASLLLVVATGCSGSSGGKGADPTATGNGNTTGPLTGATAAPTALGGSGPLAEAKVYKGLTQNHIGGPIRYRQTPPVGGDHNPIWANCGYYAHALDSPYGVHVLEHGGVWITFRPSLPAAQQQVLKDLVTNHAYLLVSPWADDSLPAPVVLTAWGVQLPVPSATDPAVAAFVQQFERGPQTPEPGAPCSGGVGTPDIQSRVPA